MKTRSWTPLPLGPLPWISLRRPQAPFHSSSVTPGTPLNPRDQLSKGTPRTHPIRNSCSRERCDGDPILLRCGCQVGRVRRGGEGEEGRVD